ncbi:hypothetical protein AVEN_146145-1 [Araneus ventricosus]|uniref:Uncharacterized protein n=1 Tax=Araneus ventricosus TaxID=182803 RepID=A0A4Y2EI40_ARAVE|nr:hypothetical protein AVEN_146145-1 [Araneus ventricosus]
MSEPNYANETWVVKVVESVLFLNDRSRPLWPSGKGSALRPEGSKPDSNEDRRVWGLLHAKSYVVAKRPPVGVARKFGEGVPTQVSSSSSARGSK